MTVQLLPPAPWGSRVALHIDGLNIAEVARLALQVVREVRYPDLRETPFGLCVPEPCSDGNTVWRRPDPVDLSLALMDCGVVFRRNGCTQRDRFRRKIAAYLWRYASDGSKYLDRGARWRFVSGNAQARGAWWPNRQLGLTEVIA